MYWLWQMRQSLSDAGYRETLSNINLLKMWKMR